MEELQKYRKALLDELREATDASDDALMVFDDVNGGGRRGGSWDGAPEGLELRLIAALAKMKEAPVVMAEEQAKELVEKGEEVLHALYKRRDRKALQELRMHRQKCGVAVEEGEEQEMMTMMERMTMTISEKGGAARILSQDGDDGSRLVSIKVDEVYVCDFYSDLCVRVDTSLSCLTQAGPDLR